jgi:hypothetical protein
MYLLPSLWRQINSQPSKVFSSFELRATGLGSVSIANHLNADDILTKRVGTKWYGSTVNKMLSAA